MYRILMLCFLFPHLGWGDISYGPLERPEIICPLAKLHPRLRPLPEQSVSRFGNSSFDHPDKLSAQPSWKALSSQVSNKLFTVIQHRLEITRGLKRTNDGNLNNDIGFEDEPAMQALIVGIAQGQFPLPDTQVTIPRFSVNNLNEDHLAQAANFFQLSREHGAKVIAETSDDPSFIQSPQFSQLHLLNQVAYRLVHHIAADLLRSSPSQVKTALILRIRDFPANNFGEVLLGFLQYTVPYWNVVDEPSLQSYFPGKSPPV